MYIVTNSISMVINYHQCNNDGNETLIDHFFVLVIQDGVQGGCRHTVRFRIACELVN